MVVGLLLTHGHKKKGGRCLPTQKQSFNLITKNLIDYFPFDYKTKLIIINNTIPNMIADSMHDRRRHPSLNRSSGSSSLLSSSVGISGILPNGP